MLTNFYLFLDEKSFADKVFEIVESIFIIIIIFEAGEFGELMKIFLENHSVPLRVLKEEVLC